jgi:hypothetical protein
VGCIAMSLNGGTITGHQATTSVHAVVLSMVMKIQRLQVPAAIGTFGKSVGAPGLIGDRSPPIGT